MSELGRVLDPTQLDACDRGRARHRIEVPATWLSEKAELELTVPVLLACARCDGGGCGACGCSGALRAPADEATRTLRISVPPQPERQTFALRIPAPFGPEHPIAQLFVEVRGRCPAASASPGVRRLNAPAMPSARASVQAAPSAGGHRARAARRWHRRARSRRRPQARSRWRYLELVVAVVALLSLLAGRS